MTLGDWLPWTWPRPDFLSFLQLAFTILGFGLAVTQLMRAANEINATKKILAGFRSRLLGNDLLVALPQIERLDEDLASAIKAKSQDRAEGKLVELARIAPEAAVLLEAYAENHEDGLELASKVADVGQACARALADLRKGEVADLRGATRSVTRKLVPLSMEIAMFTARLKRLPDNQGDVDAGK